MIFDSSFPLQTPQVAIPWQITPIQLEQLLIPHGLKKLNNPANVNESIYSLRSQSLGGLKHNLRIKFNQRIGLGDLTFLKETEDDLKPSFDELQKHLEATLGSPSSGSVRELEKGFHWKYPVGEISHVIFDRFGLEEHLTFHRY